MITRVLKNNYYIVQEISRESDYVILNVPKSEEDGTNMKGGPYLIFPVVTHCVSPFNLVECSGIKFKNEIKG